MKANFWKPLGVTLAVLLVLKGVQIFLPPSWPAILTPILLLYVPFLIFILKKEPIGFLDRSWKQFFVGVTTFFIFVFIIFPPYTFLAHLWMFKVFHYKIFTPAAWQEVFRTANFQLLVVAIPEEFFFRGYLQTTLSRVFKPKWRILGVKLGWGWVLTAFVFAFAHSVIHLEWWHFSIFFPALLFGYLKEKTGSITAPVLFHAFSNSFMNWFMRSYS